MSEDTDAKTGGRRRRTTRAGRRRAARVPAEGGGAGSSESWSPAWSSDPDTVPSDVVEEIEDDADAREPGDLIEGEGDHGASEVDHGASDVTEGARADADDSRRTAEVVVTPFTLAQLQDDEKTNPRIRVGDLGPDQPASELTPPEQPVVSFWSRPSTRRTQDSSQELPVVAIRPSVVITPARIISDRPPPMRSARALESAPQADVARAAPAATAPAAVPAPPAPPLAPAPQPAPPLAAAPAATTPAATPAAAAAGPLLTSPLASASAVAPPATPAASKHVPPVPSAAAAASPEPAPAAAPARPAAPHTSFEPLDDASLPPPAEPTPDEGSLQIVDVEVSELEQARRSRTPPPPPPDARAKVAPPKRPPPPPSKPEDDRQKRKQVRQWWERFFSDDYLMSVRPATAAQIAKQVDFIEQSLGVSKGGTILDVGCGLGLHAVELTRRGYLVVGLDLSLSMITRAAELAQQQQLKLNVVHADIREMEFDGAFDGVICMGTTFGFFDDDANRDVLARLNHALRPGGRVLMDMVNRDYVLRFQPNLVWFEGDECVCMEESDFNYFNSRLTVKRTMMREDGKQSNAEYSVRLYSLHELGLLMQQVGFRVIEVSGQEAIRGAFFGGNSPRMLLLAERRAIARPSTVSAGERGTAELGRSPVAMPPERVSAEIPKIPKPD
jgi:SAM-dependent methyltransferase